MEQRRAAVVLTLTDGLEVAARGISMDSRRVQPGDLYVALPGARVHGAKFTGQAVDAGAVAVLTDAAGAEMARAQPPRASGTEWSEDELDPETIPVAVSDDPRRDMAGIASRIHGEPSTGLAMFGVTGTNGKTTTIHLLAAMLRELGLRVGTVGTLGFELDGDQLDLPTTTVTTPESPDLQALLADFVGRGADAVGMEVSSHALSLHRADAIAFQSVAFTNLNREHQDFHGSMEAYFEAKARLFTPEFSQHAVVHLDDPWAPRLIERITEAGLSLRTVGRGPRADYQILDAPAGMLRLAHPGGVVEAPIRLPGEFNRTNAATAVAMLDGTVVGGVPVDVDGLLPGLATAFVPGRMQPVPLGDGAPEAYVDFAHTPESVAAALSSFEEERAAGRRVIVVVGCGGDRDRGKREPMGEAAARGATVAVITDDNPRTEDPADIRATTLAGARRVNPDSRDGGDRRSAIATGLELAGPEGVVLVLGKGHEQGQLIGDEVIPFDDATVIAEIWADADMNRRQNSEEVR